MSAFVIIQLEYIMKTKYLILITLIGLIYGSCGNDEADISQKLAAHPYANIPIIVGRDSLVNDLSSFPVKLEAQNFTLYNFTVSGEKMNFSVAPHHLAKAEYHFVYDHNLWETIATYDYGFTLKAKRLMVPYIDTTVKAILWDNLLNQSLGTVEESLIRIYSTPYLSGPRVLCPSQEGEFAVINVPPNSTVRWSSELEGMSYPLVTDGKQNIRNCSAQENDNVVYADVTLSDGRVLPRLSQKIHLLGSMFSSASINTEDGREFTFESTYGGTNFNWRADDEDIIEVQGYDWTCIQFSKKSGTVYVYCDYTNQCGYRMSAYGCFTLPFKRNFVTAVFLDDNSIEISLQTNDDQTAESVSNTERGISKVEIYSSSDSRVLKRELSRKLMKAKLDIPTLTEGIYTIKAYDGIEWLQTKLIKNN